ncbi:MAG: hypothetical protein KJ065_09240 [Anaerolineae bacterium]|nr:hypothetical protein [Anaerolineae bacterium]
MTTITAADIPGLQAMVNIILVVFLIGWGPLAWYLTRQAALAALTAGDHAAQRVGDQADVDITKADEESLSGNDRDYHKHGIGHRRGHEHAG